MAEVIMPDYILACMENELIYRELTDHYWSDGGGVYVPRKKNEVQAEPKVLTNTKVKRRERTKHKRNNKRARAHAIVLPDVLCSMDLFSFLCLPIHSHHVTAYLIYHLTPFLLT